MKDGPCYYQTHPENMDDKPQNYTEKARVFASLKNLRASFFLSYFWLFQISKQTSSFMWKTQALQPFLLMLQIMLLILKEAL